MPPAFDDPEFRRRLAKLLAMLSAENPAEAEAARQKLRAHLATRQLSMLDLAEHLASVGPASAAGMQVQALDEALRRSRAETLAALQRATAAERALGHRRVHGRRRNAAAGWVATVACAVLAAGTGAAGWTWLHRTVLTAPILTASTPEPIPDRGPPRLGPPPGRPAADGPVFSWQPEPIPGATPPAAAAGRAAFVRADATPLRGGASTHAALHAWLPAGLPVLVIRTEHRGGREWSLVQTPQGQGYVAAAAITAAAR